MENEVKLSVRQLVEFIMRTGDIDSRYVEKDRMYEGAKAHRFLQKNNTALYQDYQSEVTLSYELLYKEINYSLEGRADGIFHDDGKVIVDEIKTTVLPLNLIDENFNIMHWAQAKCYAYIYAAQNTLAEIAVQLTYFNLDTKEIKRFIKSYEFSELQEFLSELIEKYSVWAGFSMEWAALRDESIKELKFPFPAFRKGQRELAAYTYRAIAAGKKLFAQAPTGTGKTISTLFPAVKAMGEEKTSKIFYLTAKTITRQVAEEAFEKMRIGGLKIKTLTLTAKEKICFCEKPVCNPEHCAFAKGHYDRINEAILDAIKNCDCFTRGTIEEYAQKHKVCPFELSLDISLWADCVICDYNYVFDPRAYLRRFFAENNGDYVFLIDEAHNLVDRSREMFSSKLYKTHFYQIKKQYKGRNKALDKILTKINKYMLDLRSGCNEQGYFITAEKQKDFLDILTKYTSICEVVLKENKELSTDNEFLQVYFETLNFILISDFYDERYVTFIESQQGEVIVKLFCLDPSFLLSEALKRGGSAIMFSATLTPLAYFREILGGGEEDKILALDSPFDSQRLCVMTANHISTKFIHREQSVDIITQMIGCFVSRKTGNYIVYFPSYKYMHDVFDSFVLNFPNITAMQQESAMTEEKREHFLSLFEENPENTLVAFCVLGGIYSEGIDLRGSRLIGTAIVSVGLPQFGVQQNIIKDYFNRKNGMGYEYTYMYPGMNKVLQAAGRVIRCESDTGAILLIDERFSRHDYQQLYPKHWHDCRAVKDRQSLESTLDDFWEKVITIK
jgi:DNA excision repair protein ERCC-2